MWERSRVEELDSDDTDTQGVGLHSDYKRFSSDTLQFTGIDLSSSSRARKTYTVGDSEGSGDSAESEFEGTDALQVALREKEEALVQSALARIRRAQEKGKTEVKLNKAEVDALERRRKRMQAAATMTERKGSGSSGGSETERRRRSDRTITVPIAAPVAAQPESRPSSRKRAKSKSQRPEDLMANPPVMLVAGPDGLAYAPSGSYTPPLAANHNSPSRPRSATLQQARGAPPAYFTYQQPSNRNFSAVTRPASSSSSSSRRPLPDDESWEPSPSRRSSASSQIYTLNPFDYQISSDAPPPIPAQYLLSQSGSQPQAHRNVSGPAEIAYSSVRRSLQPQNMGSGSGYSTAARASTSDPSIRWRADHDYDLRDRNRDRERDREPIDLVSSSEEDEEDESDDLGNGVQVFVDEREVERARDRERERDRPVGRKPVGGGNGSGNGSGSGRKKGKR